ncbi:MAG: hypothetical protein NTW49_02975 [Bacteroidia bacterium]|nr:hypothetical protein [Bacteroidia bacterium]
MRFAYILIISIVTISCSESRILQNSLRNYNVPIGYIHDSEIKNCPKTDSLIVRLNYEPLDSITRVSKVKRLVLPFIMLNYFEIDMLVKLGQSSIREKYNDFFAGSFMDESGRTACFGISDKISDDSMYTLDIRIDTCITKSKYKRSTTVIFLLFVYSTYFNETGSDAETELQVSTRLKKGDRLIAEKSYDIKKTLPFSFNGSESVDQMRYDYTVNLVESLSLSTKQCIEEIINDINTSLQKK